MTAAKLREVLADNDITPSTVWIFDAEYSCATRNWIFNKFSDSLTSYIWALSLHTWKPESWDCDDFARKAASHACVLHAKTPGSDKKGLAFGEFCYISETAGPHAINVAIVFEDDKHKVVFMEPQTRKELKLSDWEKQSCFAIRF